MKSNLVYDKNFGWFFNQYIDVDDDNFITIIISDENVEVQILNWNYESKYDRSFIDLT